MTRLACTSRQCASRYGFMPGNGFFISDSRESTVPPSAWQCRTWPVSTAIGACPRGLSEAIVAAPRESAALLTKKSAALAGDAAIHSRQTLDVYFGDTSGHVATAMEEPTLAAKLGT